eukprot:1155224-Pelagomonas_calceolata.AAC.4
MARRRARASVGKILHLPREVAARIIDFNNLVKKANPEPMRLLFHDCETLLGTEGLFTAWSDCFSEVTRT